MGVALGPGQGKGGLDWLAGFDFLGHDSVSQNVGWTLPTIIVIGGGSARPTRLGRGGFETRPYGFVSKALYAAWAMISAGASAGEQLKLRHSLVDEHLQAVDGSAAVRLSFPEQPGL